MIFRFKTEEDKAERRLEKHRSLSNWHTYFCWLPVRLECGSVSWFGVVLRRGIYSQGEWVWLYEEMK